MGEELALLKEHHIWTFIPHHQDPSGKQVIPLKFVLQYKLDENGDISCHKFHVVVKCFAQCPGIDYNETYAPVAWMESMHTVLHVGTTLDWDIHQMDVKTMFLHGNLGEEVYMEQLEGGKEPGMEDWVCWLDKMLYQ